MSPIETSKDLNEIEEEAKPIRLNRRQKGSGVLVGSPDLLTIPGVGPRNLRCRSSCVSFLSYLGFPSFENDLRRQFSSLPFFPQPEGRLLRQEKNGGAEA